MHDAMYTVRHRDDLPGFARIHLTLTVTPSTKPRRSARGRPSDKAGTGDDGDKGDKGDNADAVVEVPADVVLLQGERVRLRLIRSAKDVPEPTHHTLLVYNCDVVRHLKSLDSLLLSAGGFMSYITGAADATNVAETVALELQLLE